ncbi:hypothetical protein F66182_3356 [Fusarium sp. NRRL 66182]|nr:hypothetical protein F66182_3356 [Fusarium sp. NRRL 66182]
MEAVGAVSSIATLVEIAFKTCSSASRVLKSFQHAPKEFSRLAQQLDIVQCELQLLSEIEQQAARTEELPLLPTETALVERALSAANELISSVRNQLTQCQPRKQGSKARLQWAFKDKSQTQDLLSSLHHVESGLANVILLINVGGTLDPSKEKSTDLSPSQKTLSSLFNRNPQAWNKFYGSWRSSETSLLGWLGIQILLTTCGNALHRTWFFSCKLDLGNMSMAKALYFNLGLRMFPLVNFGFSILQGGLLVKNVVPETSELMTACRQGDTLAINALFSSRKATPYDVTPSNSGPLRYAIESGSLETFKFLCYHGADVNSTFGEFETSPLEWAFDARQIEIARFIISQGARLDYLSFRGWTPVMLLFHEYSPAVPMEFFELLSCHYFTDFDVQDRCGATALHRAALWGTAADVHALIHLGASPCLTDTHIGWTPAFEAASTNNVATLRALGESMPADFVDHLDFRGWTILHVAIEAGGLETMTLVLNFGVDPFHPILVESEDTGIVEELTPAQFARAKGGRTYGHFIHALQTAGHSVSTVEDVGEECMFWDAVET